MVQPIVKWLTVLETVIQLLHFLLWNLIDIFAIDLENGLKWASVVYALHKCLILI